MGTSKAYGSPKWPGVNSAVGDAVSSGGSDQEIVDAVGMFAGAYKNHLTSGTTAASSIDRGGALFPGSGRRPSTGGRGGGGGGTARIRSASSGARLANFINTARHSGLSEALRQFNLSDLRDKPLDDFLGSLADWLSGDGGLLDDDALNHAMAETVNELAKEIESVDDFDALLTSGDVDIEATLQIYYANILAINFEQKEYSFVREKIRREETNDFFKSARNIIQAIVRDELSQERDLSSIDWRSPEGQRIADEINQEVLEILIP
jgi:hypothetical protein